MSISNESKVIGKHGWDDMMKSFAQVCGIKTNSKNHIYIIKTEVHFGTVWKLR